MPSIPPAHFSPPHHDLSTLPAHLFQPLSMSLPAARDSSETLVDPTHQNSISLDPLNSSASSVPSPSIRYSFHVDSARRDLTLCEGPSGTPVLTARVATDEVKDKKSETSEVWVVFDGKSEVCLDFPARISERLAHWRRHRCRRLQGSPNKACTQKTEEKSNGLAFTKPAGYRGGVAGWEQRESDSAGKNLQEMLNPVNSR